MGRGFSCWTALLCAAGCGRIGFGPTPGPALDARDGDASPADSAAATFGAFGTPQNLTTINSIADDSDVSLTGDEREIFFASLRSGVVNLWTATRSDRLAPFDPPTQVTELAGWFDDRPQISADGLTLFYVNDDTGVADVAMATRPDRTSTWTHTGNVAALSTTMQDYPGGQSTDGLRMYVDSDVGAFDARDIFRFERPDTGSPWGPGVFMDALSTPTSLDAGAREYDGGRRIMFFSNRPGGEGGFDLWDAVYDGTTWTVAPVAELNDADAQQNPWISEDGRTIVYASGVLGSGDLFIARR